MKDTERIIREKLCNFDGNVAMYFDDLKGNVIKINEKEKYNAASCIKIWIYIALYKKIYEGKIDKNFELTYQDKDYVDGSGVLQHLSKGIKLPVTDVATLMMILSDNVATNMLIDLLGIDEINKVIKGVGCLDTELYSKFTLDEDEVFSETTAYDYYLVWKKFNNFELFNEALTNEMINTLKFQKYHEMIYKGIDDIYIGIEDPFVKYVVSKSGKFKYVRNDGGIVSTKNGNYILTIFIKDFKDKNYMADEYVYNQGRWISNVIFNEFLRRK